MSFSCARKYNLHGKYVCDTERTKFLQILKGRTGLGWRSPSSVGVTRASSLTTEISTIHPRITAKSIRIPLLLTFPVQRTLGFYNFYDAPYDLQIARRSVRYFNGKFNWIVNARVLVDGTTNGPARFRSPSVTYSASREILSRVRIDKASNADNGRFCSGQARRRIRGACGDEPRDKPISNRHQYRHIFHAGSKRRQSGELWRLVLFEENATHPLARGRDCTSLGAEY